MIKNYYTYSDFVNNFPDRNYFLNQDDIKDTNEKINNKEPLLFFPIDVKDINLKTPNNSYAYHTCIFGLLQDRRKYALVLSGIEPFFDIRLSSTIYEEAMDESDKIKSMIISNFNDKYKNFKYEITKTSIVSLKFYETFNAKYLFMRIHFRRNEIRCEAIKYVRSKLKLVTAEDDKYKIYYHRIVSRHYSIKFGEWIEIKNYEHFNHVDFKIPIIKTNINNIKNSDKIKDKMSLCMYWDTETYNENNLLPDYNRDKDILYMLSVVLAWSNSIKSIIRLCFVQLPSAPHNDFITIYCETEQNVFNGFINAVERFKPEFIIGFNDSEYDWKWFIYRSYMKYLKMIIEFENKCSLYNKNWYGVNNNTKEIVNSILNKCFKVIFVDKSLRSFYNNFKKEESTIESDKKLNSNSRSFKLDGFIQIDLRKRLMVMHPSIEMTSLNDFLKIYGLPSKYDIKISRTFEIYRILNKSIEDKNNEIMNEYTKNMQEVALYCVLDSHKCHELVFKSNMFLDIWENANIGYVTTYDVINYAIKLRVENKLMSILKNQGINSSSIKYGHSDSQYSGALVFEPQTEPIISKLSIRELIKKAKHQATLNNTIANSQQQSAIVSNSQQ